MQQLTNPAMELAKDEAKMLGLLKNEGIINDETSKADAALLLQTFRRSLTAQRGGGESLPPSGEYTIQGGLVELDTYQREGKVLPVIRVSIDLGGGIKLPTSRFWRTLLRLEQGQTPVTQPFLNGNFATTLKNEARGNADDAKAHLDSLKDTKIKVEVKEFVVVRPDRTYVDHYIVVDKL